MDKHTDEELVGLIRAGDKDLYGEIVRRYQTKLTHYLRKFFVDQDRLEDVLQDVFIKTYHNLYGFDIQKTFSPWIYRIAHNEAVNQLKKYSKEVINLDDAEWEIVDKNIDLDGAVDREILSRSMQKVMVKMKTKYREPLILYFFEEKSYDEISEILRIPRTTVGVRIMRAKNILKEFLSKETYGK